MVYRFIEFWQKEKSKYLECNVFLLAPKSFFVDKKWWFFCIFESDLTALGVYLPFSSKTDQKFSYFFTKWKLFWEYPLKSENLFLLNHPNAESL